MKKLIGVFFFFSVLVANAQNIQKVYGFSIEVLKNWSFDKGKNNFFLSVKKNEASVTITAHDIDIKDPIQQQNLIEKIVVEAIKKEVPNVKEVEIAKKMTKKSGELMDLVL